MHSKHYIYTVDNAIHAHQNDVDPGPPGHAGGHPCDYIVHQLLSEPVKAAHQTP